MIKEGTKVKIRGQKGQYTYEVEFLASKSKLAQLKGYRRVVKLERLIPVI